jgi:hypothetical protein
VSLDLDSAVAVDQLPVVTGLLEARFRVEHFPHRINVSAPGSDLRVQIQTEPRYGPFVARAETHEVLGVPLPVAQARDVLQGKAGAASDTTRRPSKRLV